MYYYILYTYEILFYKLFHRYFFNANFKLSKNKNKNKYKKKDKNKNTNIDNTN